MLFKNVVNEKSYAILKELMSNELFNDFNLVGGTALSLQIGHRQSIDFDLFTKKDINLDEIKNTLNKKYNLLISSESKNTFLGFINDIKIDLVKYSYDLINDIKIEDNIRLLSIEDIIPMKLVAIYQDGTRIKDFIDIAYLSYFYSLNDMLDLYKNKYGFDNKFTITKSLIYFDDIEYGNEVKMLDDNYSFQKVKDQLITMVEYPDIIIDKINYFKKQLEVKEIYNILNSNIKDLTVKLQKSKKITD